MFFVLLPFLGGLSFGGFGGKIASRAAIVCRSAARIAGFASLSAVEAQQKAYAIGPYDRGDHRPGKTEGTDGTIGTTYIN